MKNSTCIGSGLLAHPSAVRIEDGALYDRCPHCWQIVKVHPNWQLSTNGIGGPRFYTHEVS